MVISKAGIISNHDKEVKVNIEQLKKPEIEQIMFSPTQELIRAEFMDIQLKNSQKGTG